MTNISCVYCPLKESFRGAIVIHCPGRKKTLKANKTIWQPYGGELGVELGGKIPPPCMREKDARNKQANGQAISANTDILHVGIVSWTRGGVH